MATRGRAGLGLTTAARAWRPNVLSVIRLAIVTLGAANLQGPAKAAATTATLAAITVEADATQFSLDLSAAITAEVFTVGTPYQVIVDLPEITFKLPSDAGQTAKGLIKAFRFGAFGERRARIVIDTQGPVEVTNATLSSAATSHNTDAHKLQLQMRPISAASFGIGTGTRETASQNLPVDQLPPPLASPLTPPSSAAATAGAPSRSTTTAVTRAIPTSVETRPAIFDTAPAQREPPARPVIMIDPGHGGIDPGAVGPGKTAEKTVVLAVASALRSALVATGRYDVQMTRSTDVFVALDKRVELSTRAQADVFVSLHADTIENRQMAKTIRGASIYTLSEKASNEEARLMAEKENAADLAAGLKPTSGTNPDDAKPILFDLLARETASFSHLLSRSMVAALAARAHPLAHEPNRAAAFRVLRQPNAPSVLIELGFLSNPAEEQRMNEPDWQRQIASAIAAALDAYFTKKNTSTANVPLGIDFGGLPP